MESSTKIFIFFLIWQLCSSFKNNSKSNKVSVQFEQFSDFMIRFRKTYPTAEEQAKRFKIFESNLKIIEAKNNNEKGNAEYGVNKFADMTTKEFEKQMMLPFNEPVAFGGLRKVEDQGLEPRDRHPVPESFSWVERSFYPSAEDQGYSCNACTLFVMVGALSIMYSARQGQAINLSKQQLLDCDRSITCDRGSTYSEVYRAIKKFYLTTEADYPYRGTSGDKPCDTDAGRDGVASFSRVSHPTGETEIKQALLKGPLASRVIGSYIREYRSGVITDCPNEPGTHGILIVGYGVENGVPYYLCRNSWGTDFGVDNGHFKVKIGTCATHYAVYSVSMKVKGVSGPGGCCK